MKGESGKPETLPLYTANDTVRGQVRAKAAGAQCARVSLRAAARLRRASAPSNALLHDVWRRV